MTGPAAAGGSGRRAGAPTATPGPAAERRSRSAGGNLAGVDPTSIIDAAFRRAVVGMAITDPDGYYLEVNDAFCALLGYAPEELLAMSFRDITAPEDLRAGKRAMRDLGDGRSREFRFEKRYITRGGTEVWGRTTGIAVHDASGGLLRIIVQVEDLTLHRASEAMLVRRESMDELTSLSNRASFYEQLDAALELPRRSTRNLALLVINVDRFHQIVAGLGHTSGDTILREVARRLVAAVRGEDVVARLAGDEFAVLSLGLRTPLDAVSLAIDIRQMLGRPYWSGGNAVYVSVRVGVVTNVEDSDSETLVQMATAATQHAKRLAGGWALHTEGAHTSSRDELGLVSDLRAAIRDGNLAVAYQPVVDDDGAVQYVEALARWHHPDRGSIPPDQFIVLAEQNGLIDALTTCVMTHAVQQVAEWLALGIDTCIAVNLSGCLLAEPDLAERVADILQVAGVPPAKLVLEVTETAIAEGGNPAIWATLSALRATGVRISIDDFGTGYSSLSYLKELPVDELKIDRSFILDLDTDERTERIVRSIIDLAHSLNLTVVAEGVEDLAVAAQLRQLGVDLVQGYAIARPASGRETTTWLLESATAVAADVRRDERRGLDVLVVDGHPAERAALRKRLRESKHHVAQAHSGAAALGRMRKKMPDVVILDHLLPGLSGVETAPQLRAAGYAGPILLLSGSAPDSAEATRFPMDVWPVSRSDETLLLRLVEGYARSPAPVASTASPASPAPAASTAPGSATTPRASYRRRRLHAASTRGYGGGDGHRVDESGGCRSPRAGPPMSTFLMPAEPVESLDAYLASDTGGAGVRRAHELGSAATIELVRQSGLRGRGGGGFPTGQKWAGIATQTGNRRYVVCNGAEGEPGTFKDRALLRANPYQLVEGVAIAAFAVGAAEAFICLKASFRREIDAVTRAVQELQVAGICGDCKVTIVAGPDEYLFGEEKAMLEVIEGNEPLPRWLPPYLHGLFATAPQLGWQSHDLAAGATRGEPGSNPTLVNNVETLSNIPHILTRGADWFRSMGTAESPGTIVTTVVGDVLAPDVGEVELGTPLRAVIDAVGSGLTPGRSVKAVFSGVANAVVTSGDLEVPVSYEGFESIGSGLGSAGFIVYDDTTCMVDAAYRFSRFLSIESCGQCPPCKLGSSAITEHLERLETGVGNERDLDAITGWLGHVTDGSRCYLAAEEQIVVTSILRAFPEEFAEHIELGRCPRPRRLPIPKLLDLAGGRAVYDESFWRKRPDWTYAPEGQ